MMQGGLPILMYHRVESSACPVADSEEARYAVRLDAFERQLDRIQAVGKRGVSVAEVMADVKRGNTADNRVGLTFDDGNRSDYVHALPMLAAKGFTATFFVTGNRVGEAGGLEPEMIREMADAGMEVGAHGMTHRFLTTLDDDAHRAECADCKDRLDEITGRPTRTFAPPGGRCNARTVTFLRELSFEAMCTSRFGTNARGTGPFELRRLPVVRATAKERFDAMIQGTTSKLLGEYLRANALDVLRGVLGERAYARVRSALLGDSP